MLFGKNKKLLEEIVALKKKISNGDLSARVSSASTGIQKEIADTINELLESITTPVLHTSQFLEGLAQGQAQHNNLQYKGDLDRLNSAANQIASRLDLLHAETIEIFENTREGKQGKKNEETLPGIYGRML